MLALSACGTAAPPGRTTAPPAKITQMGPALSCGRDRIHLGAMPPGLTRAGAFTHVQALPKKLKIRGTTWRQGDERLQTAVVCGVRTAEQFATLVRRSTLGQQAGRPALTWHGKGGTVGYMWLARPGTAIYLSATPGLAANLPRIATATTLKPP
ncbi:hypothetical protein ACIBHX_41045 [Nonomuraea sp. NPDC050536]|uniref:hypothetical protein n=1 Tax=Nonomuraea sp. NPDC050536 TaxID=3364366 RepID=UPI0037CC0244